MIEPSAPAFSKVCRAGACNARRTISTPTFWSSFCGFNRPSDDQKVGIDIVRRALQAPARQIFENAGAEGSIIVGKLLDKGEANHGFDAQSGTYVDMVKAGIIDPTKVVRLALQGAASVAGLLITTEAMVAD